MTLFFSEIAERLVNPLNWVVVPFIVPAALPLLRLARPAAALAALAFCFTASCLTAWALAALLAGNPRISRATGVMKVFVAAALICLVLANFDLRWPGGDVELLVFQRPFLLTDHASKGLLPIIDPWCPSTWVLRAATSPAAAPWIILSAAAFFSSLAASCLVSRISRGAGRIRETRPGIRAHIPRKMDHAGILRVLVSNETSTHFEAAGARTGLLAGMGCSLWLLLSREPTISIAILGAVLVIASGFSYASNVLGHDGAAVRRYMLASLDWGRLFLAKNIAFFTAAGAPLVLLCLAAALRVSAAAGLSLGLTSVALLLLCASWGNIGSIILPSAEREGVPRRTAFLNEVFPIAVWLLPLAAHRFAGGFGGAGYAAAMLGALGVAAAVYAALIGRFSKYLASEMEGVVEKI